MPNIECAVCSEEFGHRNDTRDVIITPCGHVFHESCLAKWLQYGIKLDEPPKTCPECRQSVSMSATRRIYFNFSTVIDNVSEYIDYLNSLILDRNNKLHIANMQLKNIECEWLNKLREKELQLQGLTDKLQHLKMEYNKLKHLKQDLPKQLHEKIGKLRMKLKESKLKACSNCQASCRVNFKDPAASSNMNENLFNQTPQFNPTEAMNPMRNMQPNNCDPSTPIFNQNVYAAQSSRTIPNPSLTIRNTLDYDINTINTNFRSIRHPLSQFAQSYQTQSGYMNTNPMFSSMINPVQSAHTAHTTQQQPFTYNQTSFFLPIPTTNTTYFNTNDQSHYIAQ